MSQIISVSFNANQLKADVKEILGRKVRALTTDASLKTELQELFYTYVIKLKNFPEDTGALKLKGGGYSEKSGYDRYSVGSWGGHHGIEFGAYEDRNGKIHYYTEVLRKIFGKPVSEGFIDDMMAEGLWKEFCEKAAPIIARYMNNG